LRISLSYQLLIRKIPALMHRPSAPPRNRRDATRQIHSAVAKIGQPSGKR
jgi:hypothetical protein